MGVIISYNWTIIIIIVLRNMIVIDNSIHFFYFR